MERSKDGTIITAQPGLGSSADPYSAEEVCYFRELIDLIGSNLHSKPKTAKKDTQLKPWTKIDKGDLL